MKSENGRSRNTVLQLARKQKLRTGYFVFGGLVGIKIAEYLLSRFVSTGVWPYLLILALVSAWLILYYYKHISQLWR